ncbi:ATP-dependent Clp protease proteolytic subunit [Patescibacteria group bacterium]|nr:ATP-dependent Clp protease proteolytic subunit [Patescibacteria group bacterium]MCG2808719.1 ATP-dependent Clp protease proteolytic subunit [Candidatus Portnoybacteria bacterium]
MWQYNCLDETQLRLLEKGIVDLSGEVDGDMAQYVREAIIRLITKDSPEIKILITSSGGAVDIGLDIYDALHAYQGRKTGIVYGYARSMAAVILQACDERQCACHAHIMIHHIYHKNVSLDILRSAKKLKEIKSEMEESQNKIYRILSKRSGKNENEIREKCVKEQEMSSEKALEFGLIDKII